MKTAVCQARCGTDNEAFAALMSSQDEAGVSYGVRLSPSGQLLLVIDV